MLFGLQVLVIGVALFFCGLALLPRAATINDAGLAIFTTAFALPFGGIGAFMVFGPIIEARTNARDIRYRLTTRAAYVQRTGRFASL